MQPDAARWGSIGAAVLLLAMLTSCASDTAAVLGEDAGLNGSFEIVEDGLPVNWAFFPDPSNTESFDVSIDSERSLEGRHSIRMAVASDDSDRPPGFRSRRVPVASGRTYTVSLSAWSDGPELAVRRIVMDATKTSNRRSDLIVEARPSSVDWERYSESLTVAEGEAYVVLIAVVRGEGTIWIDDVRVTETDPSTDEEEAHE